MKKRILGLLLCLGLLLGLLPAGLAPSASAEDGKEIPNLVWRFDEKNDLIITWNGVTDAKSYAVELYQYEEESMDCRTVGYKSFSVSNALENAGSFSVTFEKDYLMKTAEAGKYSNLFCVTVTALDKYGGEIAKGSIGNGYTDEKIKADFVRYLEPAKNAYLSRTGVFCFDPVPHADRYRISVTYKTTTLLGKTDTEKTWMDLSDFVIEGEPVTVRVEAYSGGGEYIDTYTEIPVTFSRTAPLGGSVLVNDDYTVSYGGFLAYLDEQSDAVPEHQWLAYYNDAWITVPASRRWNYSIADLRVTVTVPGYDGNVTSPDDTFTDPETPYIAHDARGLYRVFNAERSPGKTVYIRLGRDFSIDNTSFSDGDYMLITNGANVDLDLCGHTLTYRRGFTGIRYGAFIYGKNGMVTIRDSQKYDPASGKMKDGRIDYYYTGKVESRLRTAVLYGDVTLVSGVIANNTHTTVIGAFCYGYYGNARFRMYGGTVEADTPLALYGQPTGQEPVGVFGGTLRVCRDHAVTISPGSVMPTFANFVIYNASGSAEVTAFYYDANYGVGREEREAKWRAMFPATARVFVDGREQADVTTGADLESTHVSGPSFRDSYWIYTPRVIESVALTLYETEPFGEPDYSAAVADGQFCRIRNQSGVSWKNGVRYETVVGGRELKVGEDFQPDTEYRAMIMVELTDPDHDSFSKYTTATVNGAAAVFQDYGDGTGVVSYRFRVPDTRPNPFEDVFPYNDYYSAVLWAYYAQPQITDGIEWNLFGPYDTVTRGQAVTFLWRAMGRPEPETKTNPFSDVPETEYYYKPVLWAVENGITDGTDPGLFEPDLTCATAHIVTFLYRTMGIGPDGWYQEAAAWAESSGLLSGLNLPVDPDTPCPRAEVVMLLYKLLAER